MRPMIAVSATNRAVLVTEALTTRVIVPAAPTIADKTTAACVVRVRPSVAFPLLASVSLSIFDRVRHPMQGGVRLYYDVQRKGI